jgi:integrase/recombinase XerD
MSCGLSTNVADIGSTELRTFIVYLQQKSCYSHHPFARPQDRCLSPHSVNSYIRSIRTFWTWLFQENLIYQNPFAGLKIPKTPRKVVATFSASQIESLLQAVDTHTALGFRDYTIILTLLDTAMRISELTALKLEDISLEDGVLLVMGKGGKERLIPYGRSVGRLLWRYIDMVRPSPVSIRVKNVFLTTSGLPVTSKHFQNRMAGYGRKAYLEGVRCSPHTLRHTAAVSFLRNGGNVFSLQRLLGHSSLNMTRHYCELADVDVIKAHATASPVDNLKIRLLPTKSRKG